MEGTLTNAAKTIAIGFETDLVKKTKIKFDTIVCSGISGILVGVPLAHKMGVKVAIVRKSRDGTHSTLKVEATCFSNEIGNYIIVDDLTDSGKTIKRIVAVMEKHTDDKAKHVATYLYDRGELRHP